MTTNSNKEYFLYLTLKVKNKEHKLTYAGIVKDNKLHVGEAMCSPKDEFNKKLGRTIALGRAVKHPLVKLDLSDKDDTKVGTIFVNFCRNLTKLS